MKHIFKILKKYTLQIIIIFILLFTQAMCDLTLPEYTSNIVNIGIQQSGIEKITPEVIRESEYKKLILFMNKQQVEKFNNSITLITKESDYIEKYPLLKEENLYLINENLDDILLLPIIMNNTLKSENIKLNDIELSYEKVESMDEITHEQFINELSNKYTEENIGLLEQIAINYVKNEYQTIGIDTDSMQLNYIIKSGLKMLLLALSITLVAISVSYLLSRLATNFSRDLRSAIVNKVMTYSNSEFESFQTSSLITRSTNDINQIQTLVIMFIRIVMFAPIMGIGALTKLKGSEMSFIIAIAISVILLVVLTLFIIAMPKFNKVQKLIDKLNLVSRETLTGIQVIRAFGNEKHEEKRFDEANKDLTKVNLFVNKIMNIMMPTMDFIMNAVCVLIIWVGASKIEAGIIQVGSLLAFITYTMQIIMSFLLISAVSIVIPRAMVSVKRIGEVLNKDTSVREIEKPLKFKTNEGLVEFKDVYFRYPDALEDVLQDISFKALPGTTTVFIGSTGSGKSTLINLIPRFFDVTGGKIEVDGEDIRNVKIKDLREKIGYVPQKGILFKGTIKSNIGFGKKISEKDLLKASEISQSLEFINDKKDKFNTEISQGGTNVSGGQRQRLSIARAIAKNPSIYIFDDSFSALDYQTDVKLRRELKKQINATIFIVAQRISTVLNADQIIVLDKGHIVGIGKHEQLIKTCEVYKEICASQLSKEEIDA